MYSCYNSESFRYVILDQLFATNRNSIWNTLNTPNLTSSDFDVKLKIVPIETEEGNAMYYNNECIVIRTVVVNRNFFIF